jgi:hypothetical protein
MYQADASHYVRCTTHLQLQIKFANNEEAVGKYNCVGRNMKRNGDHVIGVFAATDIKVSVTMVYIQSDIIQA